MLPQLLLSVCLQNVYTVSRERGRVADFAGQLKSLRESRNLSQRQLAKLIGLSHAAVGHYESASREPDLDTIRRFAEFFGVSMAYIIGDADDPTQLYPSDAVANAEGLNRVVDSLREHGYTDEQLAELRDSIQGGMYQFARALGPRITRARVGAGVSVEELASRLGVSPKIVRAWEQGTRLTSRQVAERIASILGVPVDKLVNLPEPVEHDVTKVRAEVKVVPLLIRIRPDIPLLTEANIARHIVVPDRLADSTDFAWVVSDDGLAGVGVEKDDIVYLSLSTGDLEDGDVVLATVKSSPRRAPRPVLRFCHYKDDAWWLVPANPDHPTEQADSGVVVQGIYAGLLLQRKPRQLQDLARDELIARLAQVDNVDPDTVAGLLEVLRRRKS